MSYLLDSICTITGVFHKYAEEHGDSSILNKREMKRLILKEFADVIENPSDRKTVELTFQMLDTNGDGLVDFNEYLLLILKVAEACYSHLKPREDLPEKRESSTAECGGEQLRNNRDKVEDNTRTRRSIHERGDSDQRYLPPTEGTEREQERRNYHPLEPEVPVDERSHQDLEKGDHRGRERPSHEPQEVEDGQTYWYGQQQKTEAWYHPRRQRDPPAEEDCQRWSQDLLPRNEKERQRDESQHQEVRTERRGNYPEDVETQYEIGPHDIEGCIDDEQWDQICKHDPLGECDSLPREDKRRSRLNDSEWEQRRNETQDSERRARPSDPEWRGGRRADQQDEPELRETERRRFPIRDQDGWTPSYTCQPRRREEEEDHQWSESREREQIRSHSHEPEPMDSERRPLHSSESETRGSERRRSQWHEGEDTRRQQYHQNEVIERRRPRPLETESAHCENNRPLIHRQEDNKPREKYYEEKSQGRQSQWRGTQLQDPDPKESDRRKSQLHYRSYERERSQLTEPQTRHTDQDRSCASDGSPRDQQKRQQSDGPALTEQRDSDHRSNEANRGVQRQEWRSEVVPRNGGLQRKSPRLHIYIDDFGQRLSDDQRDDEQIWRSSPYDTSTTDVEQRRREARDVNPRDSDQQMTTPFCDTLSRNVDQRQTQESWLDARDGEQQKRTNPENRDFDERQTQIRDFDKRGDEQQRRQSSSVDTRYGQQERRFSSHNIEDNITNQRRGQTHEFDQREDNNQGRSSSRNTCDRDINQGQPRTYDVNPRYEEQERGTPPHDAEGRNVNQRRMQTQNIGSRDIQQHSRFPYARDVVQRRTRIQDDIDPRSGEQQKERSSNNTYATGIDQRQSRTHNTEIRNKEEERRNPSQDSYTIDADQVGQRDDEQQRRTNTENRDFDQRRDWVCYIDPRDGGPQRRSSSHDTYTRGVDDRRTQTHEDDQKDEQQRRTPSHDSYDKDVDQRQSRSHDVNQRGVDQDRRVLFHDIGGRNLDHRRTQTYGSKNGEQQRRTHSHTYTTDIEQRQPITYDADQREQRGSISTCDGREPNQRRTQIHEYDPRDGEQQRNTTSHATLARDFDQRRTQGINRRDDGQQRQTISRGLEGRQNDQRRTQTHEIDPKDDEEQRQPHSRARDVDQRGTYEVVPRDGGQQRRTPSCDPYVRNVDHRQAQIHEDHPRDTEQHRRSQPQDTEQRASEQRRAQAPDTDTREQGENKPSYIVPREDERQKRTTSHNVDGRTCGYKGTQIREVGLLDGNRQQRNSSRGIDVTDRRRQINEGDQRDEKEPRRTTYVKDEDQRQTQRPEVDPRPGEDQRQIQSCETSVREDEQKPTRTHNVDPRNDEQERQVPSGRPKQREREQRPIQTREIDASEPKETEPCGSDPRERQRRNPSHDPRTQDANQRSTKPSEVDTRDPENNRDIQVKKSDQRRTAQTNKVDSRDSQHQRLSRNTEVRSTEQITCTQPGDTKVWVKEGATHDSGSRDHIRKRQGQQASQPGQSGYIQQEGEVAPKRQETRTQQKLELGATGDKTASSLPCGPQTIEGSTGQEPNSGARTVDVPEAAQPADGEPPGTLEKQEPVVQEGDINHPGPREWPSEEGSGEPQLPLEEEKNQLGTERPRHGAEKIPGSQELDTSQGKPSFLCEKVPPVCNPLYEYLLAQKKLEKP